MPSRRLQWSVSNAGATGEKFSSKIKYAQYVKRSRKNHSNIVNFNRGEKLFYGRMNYRDCPVVLHPHFGVPALRPIQASQSSTSPLSALNFVAEAFDMMVRYFEQCVQAGLIKGEERYLSNLVAYKAYEDPWAKFQTLKDGYKNSLSKKFKRNHVNFLTMEDFLPHFLTYTNQAVSKVPITYAGFVKSRQCTVMHSGLAIEIADLDCSNDAAKVVHFLGSPNWEFFVNTCNDFGFIIDQNIPWRIVADVSAAAMRSRESKYSVTGLGPNALFDLYYVPAAFVHTQHFIDDILDYYNASKKNRVRVKYDCGGGKAIYRSVVPRSYTPTEVYKILSPERRMSIYCALRLAEEKPEMSQVARTQIIDECLAIYRSVREYGLAIRYFENFVSKTFDKRGSFSYHRKTLPKQLKRARNKRAATRMGGIDTGEEE